MGTCIPPIRLWRIAIASGAIMGKWKKNTPLLLAAAAAIGLAAGLLSYSFPYWIDELRPQGSITLGVISSLFENILVVLLIFGILTQLVNSLRREQERETAATAAAQAELDAEARKSAIAKSLEIEKDLILAAANLARLVDRTMMRSSGVIASLSQPAQAGTDLLMERYRMKLEARIVDQEADRVIRQVNYKIDFVDHLIVGDGVIAWKLDRARDLLEELRAVSALLTGAITDLADRTSDDARGLEFLSVTLYRCGQLVSSLPSKAKIDKDGDFARVIAALKELELGIFEHSQQLAKESRRLTAFAR